MRLVANSILIIGPAKAGKTTILWKMKTGKYQENIPATIGFATDILKNTTVIEIGGQESYKQFWQSAVETNPPLILFIIDISKEFDIREYENFSKKNQLKNLLLVCNKTDLLEKGNEKKYNDIGKGNEVIFCSALTGENFWRLSEYVAEFCSKQNRISQPSREISEDIKKGKSSESDHSDQDRINALKLLEDFEGKF